MKQTSASARSVLLWTAAVVVVLVWALRDLALLIGYAVLLAYALLPVVGAIERLRVRRRPIQRGLAAAVVMLALVALVGWLLAVALPRLASEAASFVAAAPEATARLGERLRAFAAAKGLGAWLNPAIEHLRADASGLLQYLGGGLAAVAGRLVGGFGQLLGMLLLPLLAFYLVAEAGAVQASALRFVPAHARPEVVRLGSAVDRALRSYVRGQALVCLVMGITVGFALALMQFPAALLLGVVAGLAEIIPYLGFLVAAIAVALTGLSGGPLLALLGIAAYTAINWAVATFLAPRVMGRYLKMHPFVVTVSVLTGAQLLGPAGTLLALPGAAVIQAVVAEAAASRLSHHLGADAHDN